MSDSQAASGGSEDGLGARQGQLGALWGGNGKLSHARNSLTRNEAIPGARGQGPQMSEGQRMWLVCCGEKL